MFHPAIIESVASFSWQTRVHVVTVVIRRIDNVAHLHLVEFWAADKL